MSNEVENHVLDCQECLVEAIQHLERAVKASDDNPDIKDMLERIFYVEYYLGKLRRKA